MSLIVLGPKTPYTDGNGNLLSGGKLYSYVSGTTTPTPTYPTAGDADAATNANANPIVLNSRGEVPVGMYLPNGAVVDFTLKDSSDVTIWGPLKYAQGSTGYGGYVSTTLADLKALGVPSSSIPSSYTLTAQIAGVVNAGDGYGTFFWDATSTTTADGYIVIDPSV